MESARRDKVGSQVRVRRLALERKRDWRTMLGMVQDSASCGVCQTSVSGVGSSRKKQEPSSCRCLTDADSLGELRGVDETNY